MTTALSVNLNKIALLRNSREGNYPNLLNFASLAIDAGSQGITVHPRPDQRHVRADDILPLAQLCKERSVEFNIEGNPFAEPQGSYPGLLKLVEASKPDQCTLVPDSNAQLTSDHGFDLNKDGNRLAPLIHELKRLGVRVSLFMDPDITQIQLAKDINADRIELYTGPFAQAYAESETAGNEIFNLHANAAEFAANIGLGVNAGHDLNLKNMQLYKALPGLQEVSIGHALTIDALLYGFNETVRRYRAICSDTN